MYHDVNNLETLHLRKMWRTYIFFAFCAGMQKTLALILFLILINKAEAQNMSYGRVDIIMRNYKEKIKYSDDLYKLIYFIRTHFTEDSLRLRASFIWIAENIKYDVQAALKEDPSAAQLPYVIKNKKAICSGYTTLLKYFCDAFSIESQIVEGRARGGKRDINLVQSYSRSNHSWNTVRINNQWRLIDPTWAAGEVDDTDEDHPFFIKKYNEVYYFTPPDRFILNHYPKQHQFQYLGKNISEFDFKVQPLFMSAYLDGKTRAVSPDSALINCHTGDTLTIKFRTNEDIRMISAWSDIIKKASFTGPAIQKGEWIEFRYSVNAVGFYNLYIGFNTLEGIKPMVAYKLKIDH